MFTFLSFMNAAICIVLNCAKNVGGLDGFVSLTIDKASDGCDAHLLPFSFCGVWRPFFWSSLDENYCSTVHH